MLSVPHHMEALDRQIATGNRICIHEIGRCGLRSGYMRLHFTFLQSSNDIVVVCGQAICDYTVILPHTPHWQVVVCGQAICDYTVILPHTPHWQVVVCGQAICDYTYTIGGRSVAYVVVCGQAICDYTAVPGHQCRR